MLASGSLFRRKSIMLGFILTALLLGLIWPSASLAWNPSVLTAKVIGVSGAVMGMATFTRESTGEVTVEIQVSGFNPVGGNHRLAITEVGQCCPPAFACAGREIAVLPPVQFYPNGSANYRVTTNAISFNTLIDSSGSSLLLHADTSQASDLIACGVIVAAQAVPPSPPPPSPSFPPTTVVASAGLKLRQGASLTSPVILTLYNGEVVYPLAAPVYNQGISWTYLRVHRGNAYYTGYAASAYLANAPKPPPAANNKLVVTASDGLRLRAGPGTGYAIRRIVPPGTTLGATGIDQWGNGILWTKVSINGIYLWAAKQYLRPL